MFSWAHEIGLEGDDLIDVTLFPYEQSLIMRLLIMLVKHPEQYLSDHEDIDIDDFKRRIDSMLNRLSVDA